MPETDLISEQCQQLLEQLNVLITSCTFHNMVFHFCILYSEILLVSNDYFFLLYVISF